MISPIYTDVIPDIIYPSKREMEMHIAGRGKIISRFYPATYITAHHGGSGEMAWGYAEAYREGHEGNVVIVDQGGMEPHEATAKAVAILRCRK